MEYTKNIEELNELLEKNYDAIRGYEEAMEDCDSKYLCDFFEDQLVERQNFSNHLRSIIEKNGGRPHLSGSASGTTHRGWMNFKTLVSSNDDKVLIEECIRGEREAIKEYETILQKNKYDDFGLTGIIADHLESIKSTMNSLKEKRNMVQN